ncbi:inactive serine protease PAMR1 isoform X1 [Clinocottus analis]|uniref:inactive serine protease PAMR1 isoform X1 n=1 Tax=Clinocottus analis TaxID=304258 RepID=UPI0035BFF88B
MLKAPMSTLLDPKLFSLLLNLCLCADAWPHGCSLFENCKSCNNGTWKANDDFFVDGKYCTACRPGWSGGDCRTCGGVIQRPQGHIAVESYPTNARCAWTVRVESGSTVELRFSQLSLESDPSCRYDHVEVRDGGDLSAPVIGRFCGARLPPPVRSSGNLVHVLFTSDGYNNLDGFVLAFQERSVSAVEHHVCATPEEPVNGYLLPQYGPEQDLVSVNYRCHPPFTLIGPQQRMCLPNGTWSEAVPTCVKGQTSRARCSPPPKLPNGYHKAAPDAAGGAEAVGFFCKNSYILSGNHQSTCLSNGSWSSKPPKCVRACREPKVSELVRQSVVKPHPTSREKLGQRLRLSPGYDVRDLLSAGFIPLAPTGDDGDAFAEFPRGLHPVRTILEYTCASPLYHHTGSSRRTCLKSGRWSGRHVSCTPVCGKFDTPGPHNLTDTTWPWHAAVYVRSAPDGPRAVPVSVQQGASEESTFWRLACSGALLSRRSVLVAAQCVVDKDKQQTLHPAHVKVVIGVQPQTAKDRQRSPHRLGVSDVSVHPDFFSAPDSAVAVLELQAKARISERVRPVCLPGGARGGEVMAREAYAARWALPNRRSRHNPTSQTSLVALADVAQCERELARGAAIGDDTLCVFGKPSSPRGPCASGVPGVLTGREETRGDAGWTLLGLESFSYKEEEEREEEEESCHLQSYTVHTRIANFRDWIEKNTK